MTSDKSPSAERDELHDALGGDAKGDGASPEKKSEKKPAAKKMTGKASARATRKKRASKGKGVAGMRAEAERRFESLKAWSTRQLLRSRSLRVQIGAGLGAAIVFTLAASIVALIAFFQVGRVQRVINTEHVPSLTGAVQIAQLATTLAGAAPRLVAAARNQQLMDDGGEAPTPTDNEGVMNLMEDAARMIELSAGLGDSERAAGLRSFSESLASNLRDIQVSVDTGVALAAHLEELGEEATVLGRQLNEQVGPPLDDQVFYMATGLRELEDIPAPVDERGSENEVIRLQALSEIDSRGNLAVSLITDAVVQEDPQLLATLEERFRAASTGAARALATLGDRAPAGLGATLGAINELGLGETGAFIERGLYLEEVRNQLNYLSRNESITDSLEATVAGLTVGLEVDAQISTEQSEQAFSIGRVLLVVLNVLGITSAVLILWLFIGRVLIVRLTNLSTAMRRMADGDLETKIEVKGRDEVGDMAQALEVFRKHALEVQRLNLVEDLAKRVEAQNKELAATLEDLEKAQDQMVMQEKLASLGQLTAGIAHEIKNPLNFVNNFADISKGLLDDLQEELNAITKELPEDARAEVDDISKDLTGNLDRIVHHGKRASSIVYGMLEHARNEGGEARPTEVNSMLEEYIALAFHSMRAVDGRFQMTINKNFGPDVGEVQAVPQDLSRVFLNIVSNACQATFEKQKSPDTDKDYEPTLTVESKREDDEVEVRISDNGPGIPKKLLDKIFEPFFTTKETDKGTGLGLSLSHDIVRSHGGSLVVTSEPGEGAEFVVTIPVSGPAGGATASGETRRNVPETSEIKPPS